MVLGDRAPALITLRRHARAGDLVACEANSPENRGRVRGQGGATLHKRYLALAVIEHYQARLADGPQYDHRPAGDGESASPADRCAVVVPVQQPARQPEQARAPAPVAPGVSPDQVAALAGAVAQLSTQVGQVSEALEDMRSTLKQMRGAMSDLNATRTSLMLKYDANAALLQDKVSRLEEGARAHRSEDLLAAEISRIRRMLHDVLDGRPPAG